MNESYVHKIFINGENPHFVRSKNIQPKGLKVYYPWHTRTKNTLFGTSNVILVCPYAVAIAKIKLKVIFVIIF